MEGASEVRLREVGLVKNRLLEIRSFEIGLRAIGADEVHFLRDTLLHRQLGQFRIPKEGLAQLALQKLQSPGNFRSRPINADSLTITKNSFQERTSLKFYRTQKRLVEAAINESACMKSTLNESAFLERAILKFFVIDLFSSEIQREKLFP